MDGELSNLPKFTQGKTPVPEELRQVILDFTICFLLEQPTDIVTFGIKYFKLLQTKKVRITKSPEIGDIDDDDGSVVDASGDELPERGRSTGALSMTSPIPRNRGKSVFTAPYDPEADTSQIAYYEKSSDDEEKLEAMLRNVLLFKTLEPEHLKTLVGAMFAKNVDPEEYVIRQGDDGDFFYVVDSGVFETYSKETEGDVGRLVHTYDGTGSFGELALLYNVPRAASVKAITRGKLWALDRDSFRKIVSQNSFQRRKLFQELIQNVPILKELNEYERLNLADALTSRTFFDGECIIRQGDAAQDMFFIENGTVRVVKINDQGQETQLREVGAGGYFGELALVTKRPRAATVIAKGTVKVARLDVDTFERLLGPCREIMARNIASYDLDTRS